MILVDVREGVVVFSFRFGRVRPGGFSGAFIHVRNRWICWAETGI